MFFEGLASIRGFVTLALRRHLADESTAGRQHAKAVELKNILVVKSSVEQEELACRYLGYQAWAFLKADLCSTITSMNFGLRTVAESVLCVGS